MRAVGWAKLSDEGQGKALWINIAAHVKGPTAQGKLVSTTAM